MLRLQVIARAQAELGKHIAVQREYLQLVAVQLGECCDGLLVDQAIGPLAVGRYFPLPGIRCPALELRQAGRNVAELHLGQNALVIDLSLAGDQIGSKTDDVLLFLFGHLCLYICQSRSFGISSLAGQCFVR